MAKDEIVRTATGAAESVTVNVKKSEMDALLLKKKAVEVAEKDADKDDQAPAEEAAAAPAEGEVIAEVADASDALGVASDAGMSPSMMLTGASVSGETGGISNTTLLVGGGVLLAGGAIAIASNSGGGGGGSDGDVDSITPSAASVNEEASQVSFNLKGDPGSTVSYTLTGTAKLGEDYTASGTPNQVTFDANGNAVVTITTIADLKTEPGAAETIILTANGVSATISINDTSLTPAQVVSIEPSVTSINESEFVVFTITGVPGATVAFTLGGTAGPGDYTVNPAGNSVVLDAAGKATVVVSTISDNVIENPSETITLIAGGVTSAAVTVNDLAAGTFVLTKDQDIATANIFQSAPVLVPGTGFINTLSDIDELTGTGTNPTLNVTFGANNDITDSNVVQPKLTGVETINAEWTGADTDTFNLADATGLKTVNINRITTNNQEILIEDLDKTVTTLGVSNATRTGRLEFDYREDVLTATDDALALNINNARLGGGDGEGGGGGLFLSEGGDGGADQGYFFETINTTTTGNNDLDSFVIQANGREDLFNSLPAGTTTQTLNITVNGTPTTGSLEINNLVANGLETISIVANARVDITEDKLLSLRRDLDGITTDDLEVLNISGAANVTIDGLDTTKQESGNGGKTLTVNAGTMTGNLKLGVETPSDSESSTTYAFRADKDLSVTSGSGNDEIRTYGVLAGDISTGLGNDIVVIENGNSGGSDFGNVEGVSTIDAGDGDNTVTALDLLVTATDSNEVDNDDYNDVTAARIITGSGADTVTVRDLTSNLDWDNKNLEDTNIDDLYVVKGASISTGAGTDTVNARTVAEGASIDTGDDDDIANFALNPLVEDRTSGNPSEHTVLAGDTDADRETVRGVAALAGDTREVTDAEVADRLGAVVDLGNGTDDVANFIEGTSFGANVVTIVGRDAELRNAETVNVTALDRITVTTNTSTVDQDVLTDGVQSDLNANVIGTQVLNLTIANQIDEDTADATGLDQNDTFVRNDNAVITLDVLRFDSALQQINLVSEEQPLLLNPATEEYEAGTKTNFTLNNMREGVALSLEAQEATGVVGPLVAHEGDDVRVGALKDDSLLVISSVTGVVNAAVADTNVGAAAADVTLIINYADARELDDAVVLDVAATSGAFDLDLNVGQTLTDVTDTDGDGNLATVANPASALDDDTRGIENFTVKFADTNSHSIDANGFGDVPFRGVNDRPEVVAGDVSSTAITSFNVWSAAGAGKDIAIDAVNADTIRVLNADGTAVTAANVTLRVDAANNYNITTGSGTDILDLRADNVRSDDNVSALDRADRINAGTGRDTLIINGSDSLGVNNNIEGGTASTIIDDDVFATLRGIEKILVDANYFAGAETLRITLDEEAKATGVDTVAIVGTDAQTLNLEIGNNFVVGALPVDNANGQLVSATSALLIDASLNTGATVLNIESKDDDTDIQLINLDIRVDSDGGTNLNIINTGDVAAQVEVRVYTADENDAHTISSGNAGNADGLVDIDVTTGSFDKLIVLEGENADAPALVEAAMTIAIDADWTGAAFTVDASAVLDTDANLATGGATITAAVGDTAALTLQGTQNSDTIFGGRLGDVINGNAGDDVITGDEVTNQFELEVVTFAATYDAGDVITVTHNGQAITATIGADGVTGAAVAAAFASHDNFFGLDILPDNITTTGGTFGSAISTANASQLRLTAFPAAGVDYVVTATTNNAGDNIQQAQTLTVTAAGDWNVTVVFNGTSYVLTETAGAIGGVGYAPLVAAVTALGGTVANSPGPNTVTITGPASGAAFPLITQADIGAGATAAALAVVAGDQGTDQPNPQVVTETLAQSVVGAADTIDGGTGNDIIAGLVGGDTLNGGDGFDTLDYSLSIGGVTISLAANTASGGDATGDIISNFEAITGSAFDDSLTGSDVANLLTGGAGNDTIIGGAGNDTISGGVGSDVITGGLGNDTINLGAGDGVEDIVKFASGDGVDSVSNFATGIDTIQFTDFADRDLLPGSILQQTANSGTNTFVSGNNTELLVVNLAADVDDSSLAAQQASIASSIDSAFDLDFFVVDTLADGRVMFAVNDVAGNSYVGYYTDVGADDTVAAADIELLAVFNATTVGANDFWLPTV